jgi:Bacterial Ig domain
MRKIFTALAAGAAIAIGAASAYALTDGLNAHSDHFTTFKGQKLTISFGSLLGNDTCKQPCIRPISFLTAFSAKKTFGTLKIQNGRIVFTPAPGFTGQTRFKYTIVAFECAKFRANGSCKRVHRIEDTDVVHIRVRRHASLA